MPEELTDEPVFAIASMTVRAIDKRVFYVTVFPNEVHLTAPGGKTLVHQRRHLPFVHEKTDQMLAEAWALHLLDEDRVWDLQSLQWLIESYDQWVMRVSTDVR